MYINRHVTVIIGDDEGTHLYRPCDGGVTKVTSLPRSDDLTLVRLVREHTGTQWPAHRKGMVTVGVRSEDGSWYTETAA